MPNGIIHANLVIESQSDRSGRRRPGFVLALAKHVAEAVLKVAIIGGGISGLVVAHDLYRDLDITLYEAAEKVGGHTNTVTLQRHGRTFAIDTGFIVFNDWTYPRFTQLLAQLGVASQPSCMSFSVTCARTGLEYNGTSFNKLFAQRRNLFRPSFWRMLNDIRQFNRKAKDLLDSPSSGREIALDEYLAMEGFSSEFRDHYILPMGSAIWSASRKAMLDFPLAFFLKFLDNHGMLSIDDRPQWRTVVGGSQTYVQALIEPFQDRIETGCPVLKVTRNSDGVRIFPKEGPPRDFDYVVFATHADQTLALLDQPTALEREILGSFPYQENLAVLHTDTSILPRRRPAWASWNYYLLNDDIGRVSVTYNMNILQNIQAPETFCVTLNCQDAIDPSRILRRIVYHHPLYTVEGVANQARHGAISGVNRSFFAGAYWFNGFHEDGVRSGQRVVGQLREVARV